MTNVINVMTTELFFCSLYVINALEIYLFAHHCGNLCLRTAAQFCAMATSGVHLLQTGRDTLSPDATLWADRALCH